MFGSGVTLLILLFAIAKKCTSDFIEDYDFANNTSIEINTTLSNSCLLSNSTEDYDFENNTSIEINTTLSNFCLLSNSTEDCDFENNTSTESNNTSSKCCPESDFTEVYDFENNTSTERNNTLRKCCPRDQSLIYLEDNDNYNCNVSFNDDEFWKYYNIEVPSEDGDWIIPCDGYNLEKLDLLADRLIMLPGYGSSCVDYFNDSVTALYCVNNETAVMPKDIQIVKVQKCCKYDENYSVYERRCVANSPEIEEQFYTDLFQNYSGVVIHGYSEICQEVSVEYNSAHNKLQFEKAGSMLNNTLINETTEHYYFCLEIVTKKSYIKEYEKAPAEVNWIAKTCQTLDMCKTNTCFRKCCLPDSILINETCEIADSFKSFDEVFRPKFKSHVPLQYGVIYYKLNCVPFSVNLDSMDYEILPNGSLMLKDENFEKPLPNDEYCIDYMPDSQEDDKYEVVVLICINSMEKQESIMPEIYYYMLILSCVALVFTMIYYMASETLMNLNGKTLSCYVVCLFCAYLGLAFNNSMKFKIGSQSCVALGYMVYFSLLSTFAWLNVLCYDIYRSFGMSRYQRSERYYIRRFIYYSLYAWGLALTLTSITYCIDKYKLLPNDFLPMIGEKKCFFSRSLGNANIVFMVAPICVFLFINLMFFIKITRYCNEIKADINRISLRNSVGKMNKKDWFKMNRKRHLMNIKLFLVMGILWIFDVAASIYPQWTEVWFFTNCLNSLQGVLIMLVFVVKRTTILRLKRRLFGLPKYMRPTSFFFSSSNGHYEVTKMETLNKD